MTFDTTNDDSPIVMGMEVRRYSVTDNLAPPTRIRTRRPSDKGIFKLETYMSTIDPHKERFRLLVAPSLRTTGLILETRKPLNMRPLTLAKRVPGMTHVHPDQMTRI